MIIYTPLPLEIVMKEVETYKPHYLQIPFKGGFIEVELTSPTTARIVRLNSINLSDYLHPALQPGKEIKLRWDI